MGIRIGIGSLKIGQGSTGVDWSSYWKTQFTGVPKLYANNPLNASSDLLRSVVLVEGVYHMFYERVRGSGWAIYKKTSIDGLHFDSMVDELFAVGAGGSYDELGQADPSVIYDGAGDWKMWAEGLAVGDIYTQWDTIFYAQSVDGTTWTKTGAAIERGASGAWDDGYLHHPCVVKHNGVYYMFYTGAKSSNAAKQIGLATSPDGATWTKHASNPILINGALGTKDSNLLRPSNPILIYDTWYMWYWGSNGTMDRCFLATSQDLITWVKQGEVLEDVNHTGSANLLVEGANGKDKIVQHWFTPAGTGLPQFSTITLPTDKTLLSGFVRDQAFGDTTETGLGTNQVGYVYFNQVVVSGVRQNIKSISIFIGATSKPTTGKMKLALYSEVGGTAGLLLGATEEKNWSDIVAASWTEFDLATELEIADGNYWVGIQTEQTFYKPKVAGGANNWGYVAQAYGNFPSPAGGTTNQAFTGIGVVVNGNGSNTNTIALEAEPSNVYFNNISGNKKTSIAGVDSEFDWFWTDGLLYVYSVPLVDVRYQISYE